MHNVCTQQESSSGLLHEHNPERLRSRVSGPASPVLPRHVGPRVPAPSARPLPCSPPDVSCGTTYRSTPGTSGSSRVLRAGASPEPVSAGDLARGGLARGAPAVLPPRRRGAVRQPPQTSADELFPMSWPCLRRQPYGPAFCGGARRRVPSSRLCVAGKFPTSRFLALSAAHL